MLLYHCSLYLSLHIGESSVAGQFPGNNLQRWCSGAHYPDPVAHRHSIERYLAIRSAFGRGSLVKFVANIKSALAAGDMKKAQELCDKQGGSVANVVTSTLRKYADVENDATLSKDQKVLAIQKELEEATALELPMMEQKLPNMHSALKM